MADISEARILKFTLLHKIRAINSEAEYQGKRILLNAGSRHSGECRNPVK